MFNNMNWFSCSNTDARAVELYSRHYSSRKTVNPSVWRRCGITGPGEVMTLLTTDALALFVWQKQQYAKHGQDGVNCAVFRNESQTLSSALIKEAVGMAWERWPNERLFTFVNPIAVRGDGKCFKAAGWSKCGRTSKGLIILELKP